MTGQIDPRDIERHMRRSRQLRSEAFLKAAAAFGRGVRNSARTLVAVFV